jgi:hypothetical protein
MPAGFETQRSSDTGSPGTPESAILAQLDDSRTASPGGAQSSSDPVRAVMDDLAGEARHLGVEATRETVEKVKEQVVDQVANGDLGIDSQTFRQGIAGKIRSMFTSGIETVADKGVRNLINQLPDDPRFNSGVFYNVFLSPKSRVVFISPADAAQHGQAITEEYVGKPVDQFLATQASGNN